MADSSPSDSTDTDISGSDTQEPRPRIIGVDSEEADDFLSALSSDTARNLLSHLHDEPATPSELADSVDTSVQNARYHLQNLEEAGLVEPTDTKYSPKGREMNVYEPSGEPIVIFPGSGEGSTRLRDFLMRFVSSFAVLALAAVVVDRTVSFFRDGGFGMGAGSPDGSGSVGSAGGGAGDGGEQAD
ncbi:MAG: helix-turn-helix domain-containing protein, partial [Halobacteria archaeon]|nr:helix-turn-helix domain-containing protein [Halobacteria archaeon]